MRKKLYVPKSFHTGPIIHPGNVLAESNWLPDPQFLLGNTTGWSQFNTVISFNANKGRKTVGCLQSVISGSSGSAFYTAHNVPAGAFLIFWCWVLGDSNSKGKFVQGKIKCEATQAFQDTVPYMLDDKVWQRVLVTYVNPSFGDVTFTLQGFDTVSGNNIFIDDVMISTYKLPSLTVSGRKLLLDNIPVYLRMCNYNNAGTGAPGGINFAYEAKVLPYDMALLKAQGCNGFRVYYDNYVANDYGRGLDVALNYNQFVLVDYFIWISGGDYSVATGGTNRTATISAYTTMCTNLKNHPAVLFCGFGSEGNYHLGSNSSTDWYSLLDACAAAGKGVNTHALQYTSNGGLPHPSVDSQIPNVDVFGLTQYGNPSNVYRDETLDGFDVNNLAIDSQKPLMLTEIGTGMWSAGGDQQQAQSDADVRLLQQTEGFRQAMCGHTYFQFMDNRGDTSEFGVSEVLATGAAQTRITRIAYTGIKNLFASNVIPQ